MAMFIVCLHKILAVQEAAPAAGNAAVLHLFGAAIGLGMIVIGAALGIGKFAAAAVAKALRASRPPPAITGAVNLPLFLLEGVAILRQSSCS